MQGQQPGHIACAVPSRKLRGPAVAFWGHVDARGERELSAGLTPELAALETTVFLAGLMRLSLLDDRGTSVRKHARELIAAHVASRRAPRK